MALEQREKATMQPESFACRGRIVAGGEVRVRCVRFGLMPPNHFALVRKRKEIDEPAAAAAVQRVAERLDVEPAGAAAGRARARGMFHRITGRYDRRTRPPARR